MYFTIYKVTNLLDGKYYLGMHKTKNLDDGYMGSGKLLKRAISKHGIENFRKDILFILDSEQEMFKKEAEIITEDLIKDPMCYNLTVGGFGGNRITNSDHKTWSSEHARYMNQQSVIRYKEDEEFRKRVSDSRSQTMKRTHREGKIKYDTFTGKQHNPETKKKISESMIGKRNGSKNSQFGSKWITNGEVNIKIYDGDKIPEGFRFGRSILERKVL